MTYFSRIVLIAVLLCGVAFAQQSYSAIDFNYPALIIERGNTATGSQTIYLRVGQAVTPGGITFTPITTNTPLKVGSGSTTDSVTPSGVSCTTPQIAGTCAVTATFTYTHGRGERVTSATYGLQEAANYAALVGGGSIVTDANWTRAGGTAGMVSAVVYPSAGTVTMSNGASGLFVRSASVPAVAGTVRTVTGSIKTGASALTSGNIVGVRGDATVSSGTTVASGYIYGAQGKVILSGTSNTQSGGGIIAGVFGQLDASNSTITNTGDTAAGWFDISGGPSGAAAKVMGIGITNSTSMIAGAAIHVATTSGGFSNLFEIDDVSNKLAKTAAGTSAGQCAQTDGLVPTKAIPVKIGTDQYYIPLCTIP